MVFTQLMSSNFNQLHYTAEKQWALHAADSANDLSNGTTIKFETLQAPQGPTTNRTYGWSILQMDFFPSPLFAPA
jgi:hypothetical protein